MKKKVKLFREIYMNEWLNRKGKKGGKLFQEGQRQEDQLWCAVHPSDEENVTRVITSLTVIFLTVSSSHYDSFYRVTEMSHRVSYGHTPPRVITTVFFIPHARCVPSLKV